MILVKDCRMSESYVEYEPESYKSIQYLEVQDKQGNFNLYEVDYSYPTGIGINQLNILVNNPIRQLKIRGTIK